VTAVPRPRRPGSAQRPLRSDSASERGPPDRTVSARPGRPGTPGRLTLPSAAFQARVPVPRPGPRPGPERLLFRILPGWTSCPPPILVLPAEAPVRSPPSQPGVLHPRLSARIPGPLPQSRPPPRSSPHPGSSPCCLPSRVPAGSGPTRVQGSARPRVPDWAPCPWRAGAAVSVTAADPVRRGGAAAAPGGRPAALSEASPSFRPPPPRHRPGRRAVMLSSAAGGLFAAGRSLSQGFQWPGVELPRRPCLPNVQQPFLECFPVSHVMLPFP
jgi:hypothetical protein